MKKSNKRLFILFALSMLLSPLMPVLFMAVIPMAVGMLSSDRKVSYPLFISGLLVGALLTWQGSVSVRYFSLFVFTSFVAGLLAEQIKRGIHPGKIFFSTSMIASMVAVSTFLYQKSNGYSFMNEISKLEQVESERLKNDEKLASQWKEDFAVLKQRVEVADKFAIPMIMGLIFINVWFVLYFILGSYQFYAPISEVKYTNLALLNFEFPFFLIWCLVLCLSLFLGAETLGLNTEAIDITLGVLAFLGSLFFIQGFSVLITYLNKFEIFGFFRTLIMVLSILMFSYVISLLGVFEYWGEFRKKSKKKLNKV